jgi:hypothetical protein
MSDFGSIADSIELWRFPVADLVVSAERAKWIMAVYPPEDTGRPGVFAADSHRGAGAVRIADVAPLDEVEIDGELELAAD